MRDDNHDNLIQIKTVTTRNLKAAKERVTLNYQSGTRSNTVPSEDKGQCLHNEVLQPCVQHPPTTSWSPLKLQLQTVDIPEQAWTSCDVEGSAIDKARSSHHVPTVSNGSLYSQQLGEGLYFHVVCVLIKS